MSIAQAVHIGDKNITATREYREKRKEEREKVLNEIFNFDYRKAAVQKQKDSVIRDEKYYAEKVNTYLSERRGLCYTRMELARKIRFLIVDKIDINTWNTIIKMAKIKKIVSNETIRYYLEPIPGQLNNIKKDKIDETRCKLSYIPGLENTVVNADGNIPIMAIHDSIKGYWCRHKDGDVHFIKI